MNLRREQRSCQPRFRARMTTVSTFDQHTAKYPQSQRTTSDERFVELV
ncbi:MAG: hypothetical protein H0T92_15790 [Pyrinomonadaceae bacterium]|nr:hypothetical protein [Pyrinomonadaceae bacterium]